MSQLVFQVFFSKLVSELGFIFSVCCLFLNMSLFIPRRSHHQTKWQVFAVISGAVAKRSWLQSACFWHGSCQRWAAITPARSSRCLFQRLLLRVSVTGILCWTEDSEISSILLCSVLNTPEDKHNSIHSIIAFFFSASNLVTEGPSFSLCLCRPIPVPVLLPLHFNFPLLSALLTFHILPSYLPCGQNNCRGRCIASVLGTHSCLHVAVSYDLSPELDWGASCSLEVFFLLGETVVLDWLVLHEGFSPLKC